MSFKIHKRENIRDMKKLKGSEKKDRRGKK